ncbi:MAG: hypothetical protein BA865_05710 [Desulfobacterales bacterium S5133MH4]|nr:MAG: hypothetical protein BA865_05710 [Desulfobacterales bacterium S5133MH4]
MKKMSTQVGQGHRASNQLKTSKKAELRQDFPWKATRPCLMPVHPRLCHCVRQTADLVNL